MFTLFVQIVTLIASLQRFDIIQLKDGCCFVFMMGVPIGKLEHSELQK